jgi:hypothetical protein
MGKKRGKREQKRNSAAKLLRLKKRLGNQKIEKKRTRRNVQTRKGTKLTGASERLGKRLLVSNAQGPVSSGGLFLMDD